MERSTFYLRWNESYIFVHRTLFDKGSFPVGVEDSRSYSRFLILHESVDNDTLGIDRLWTLSKKCHNNDLNTSVKYPEEPKGSFAHFRFSSYRLVKIV